MTGEKAIKIINHNIIIMYNWYVLSGSPPWNMLLVVEPTSVLAVTTTSKVWQWYNTYPIMR